MSERRKRKRGNLAYFTRVFNLASGDLLGHLADLTPDGLMLISDQPIYTDVEFHIQVDLSDSPFEEGSLEFKARSVWCVPDLDPKQWNTGFMITEITDANKSIVEKVIQEYSIRD